MENRGSVVEKPPAILILVVVVVISVQVGEGNGRLRKPKCVAPILEHVIIGGLSENE